MSPQKNEEITYDPKTETYELSGQILKKFEAVKKDLGEDDNEKAIKRVLQWFLERHKTVEVKIQLPKNLYDCIVNELLEDPSNAYPKLPDWIIETIRLQIGAEIHNKDFDYAKKIEKKYRLEEDC